MKTELSLFLLYVFILNDFGYVRLEYFYDDGH